MGECNMIVLILFFVLLAIFSIGIQGLHRKMEKAKRTEEENRVQKQIILQQKEVIQKIRKKQHEYKNNLGNINALLLSQDVEKARNLMDELLQQNVSVDRLLRRNGNFIGLLLDYKIQEAERKQIKTVQDVVMCQDLPIDEYDIAIVINNAMNNAIEACEKLSVKERYIRCIVNMKMGYLNFYFENPCTEIVEGANGELITSKTNKEEHGIGMQNIMEVVRKYDGFTSYGVEHGVFGVRCSLRIAGMRSA